VCTDNQNVPTDTRTFRCRPASATESTPKESCKNETMFDIHSIGTPGGQVGVNLQEAPVSARIELEGPHVEEHVGTAHTGKCWVGNLTAFPDHGRSTDGAHCVTPTARDTAEGCQRSSHWNNCSTQPLQQGSIQHLEKQASYPAQALGQLEPNAGVAEMPGQCNMWPTVQPATLDAGIMHGSHDIAPGELVVLNVCALPGSARSSTDTVTAYLQHQHQSTEHNSLLETGSLKASGLQDQARQPGAQRTSPYAPSVTMPLFYKGSYGDAARAMMESDQADQKVPSVGVVAVDQIDTAQAHAPIVRGRLKAHQRTGSVHSKKAKTEEEHLEWNYTHSATADVSTFPGSEGLLDCGSGDFPTLRQACAKSGHHSPGTVVDKQSPAAYQSPQSMLQSSCELEQHAQAEGRLKGLLNSQCSSAPSSSSHHTHSATSSALTATLNGTSALPGDSPTAGRRMPVSPASLERSSPSSLEQLSSAVASSNVSGATVRCEGAVAPTCRNASVTMQPQQSLRKRSMSDTLQLVAHKVSTWTCMSPKHLYILDDIEEQHQLRRATTTRQREIFSLKDDLLSAEIASVIQQRQERLVGALGTQTASCNSSIVAAAAEEQRDAAAARELVDRAQIMLEGLSADDHIQAFTLLTEGALQSCWHPGVSAPSCGSS
jgi:hypothetical protein